MKYFILFLLVLLPNFTQANTVSGEIKIQKKNEVISTLTIGSELKDCIQKKVSRKCLQVQNSKTKKWENFFGTIQGFTFLPGSISILKVEKKNNDYTLIKVLSQKSVPFSFVGTQWNIVSLNGKNITHSGTLEFKEKKIAGKLCNAFGGSYQISSKGTLRMNLFSTRMYCDNDGMRVEEKFINSTLFKYTIQDSILTLTTNKKDVIVWKRK